MSAERRYLALAVAAVVVLIVLLFSVRITPARDLGQWDNNADPAVAEWYRSLMQPDNPVASCCGEADAYFADDVHFKDGKTFAAITDDRPDEPRHRPHIAIGTEIEIPNNTLKWDRSNPTGHGVVFLSRGGFVYCYVQPGGV